MEVIDLTQDDDDNKEEPSPAWTQLDARVQDFQRNVRDVLRRNKRPVVRMIETILGETKTLTVDATCLPVASLRRFLALASECPVLDVPDDDDDQEPQKCEDPAFLSSLFPPDAVLSEELGKFWDHVWNEFCIDFSKHNFFIQTGNFGVGPLDLHESQLEILALCERSACLLK